MSNELETMTYMMAAEKMGNLLFTLEGTMDFMEEYKIIPDEEVKKSLNPLLNRMKKWLS
jgi:hypothetical protein